MSFLKAAAPALSQPNSAAMGLGRMTGWDPSRISQIAGGIGNAANGIATAGGAPMGYQAPQQQQMPQSDQQQAAPNNIMQMLDPAMLQRIVQQFGGQGQFGGQMR